MDLKKTLQRFETYLKQDGQKWHEEREQKQEFIDRYFSEKGLNELDEGTLRELIQLLWAFNGWTNKDYLHREMMESGLEKIREAFRYLLLSGDSLTKRYDKAIRSIKMLGSAGLTEILAHHDHANYPIYNKRSKRGLIKLGVDSNELPKSAQISGRQYERFCNTVYKLRDNELKHEDKFHDLFYLDFFLYYLSIIDPMLEGKTAKTLELTDFGHSEAIGQLLELGNGLGFDVEKEYFLMTGCKIDAIWKSRVANLGTISYAFEVHRRGSADSAILNLQRVLKHDPTIQKVIVVSTATEIDKFRGEISSLGEDFREAVGYFKIDDLILALENLDTLKSILNKIGLLKLD
ncbi:MAG TPA: hypothetical protein ENN07_02820 [candidate division Zixibacteria bacterium]|nr:hypothetical protein [candidate division Zixibacteria bacterium]